MPKYAEYLSRFGAVLKAEIEAIRAGLTDSDAKRGAFETVGARCFKQH